MERRTRIPLFLHIKRRKYLDTYNVYFGVAVERGEMVVAVVVTEGTPAFEMVKKETIKGADREVVVSVARKKKNMFALKVSPETQARQLPLPFLKRGEIARHRYGSATRLCSSPVRRPTGE